MMEGKILFSQPIVGSKTEDRILIEVDNGSARPWIVGRVLRSDRTKFTHEFAIGMEDIVTVSIAAFAGDPSINAEYGRQPGKALAAGFVLLAMGLGIIKTEPKK